MMRLLRPYLSLLFSLAAISAYSDEAGLNAVLKDWDTKQQEWVNAEQQAATPAEKQALKNTKPNSKAYFQKLWRQLAPIINEPAAVPGITWLMAHKYEYAPALSAQDEKKLAETIYNAILDHLYDQYGIGRVAPYLIDAGAQGRTLLHKIRSHNINPSDQGMAALALAISMKEGNTLYADDPKQKTLRSIYVKEAILKAYDEPFGASTVKDWAQELIYDLVNLSTRCKAPAFQAPFHAQTFKIPSSQPTLLVFWHPASKASIIFAQECIELPKQHPNLQVQCITTLDDMQLAKLSSSLESPIPSISDTKGDIFKLYRIPTTPFIYLIDGNGIIRLRGVPDLLFSPRLKQLLASIDQPSTPPSGSNTTALESTPATATTVSQPETPRTTPNRAPLPPSSPPALRPLPEAASGASPPSSPTPAPSSPPVTTPPPLRPIPD